MIFGGLSPQYKGTLWKSEFPWIITESATYHGTTPIFTTEAPACPSMLDPIVGETTTLVRFWGQPGAKYHVYRSRNESGANNGKSNGQYFYLATLTADQGGNFQYTDDVTELNWYIAVQADPTTNAPIGCHSEPVEPTAAVLSGFTSSFDLETTSVDLSWETFSDANIMGFNVYRSDGISPDLVKINPEMVLVYQPGSMEGNQYSYTDAGVEFGRTYTYWIDVVDSDGQPSHYGPVTQSAGFSVFVPILQR